MRFQCTQGFHQTQGQLSLLHAQVGHERGPQFAGRHAGGHIRGHPLPYCFEIRRSEGAARRHGVTAELLQQVCGFSETLHQVVGGDAPERSHARVSLRVRHERGFPQVFRQFSRDEPANARYVLRVADGNECMRILLRVVQGPHKKLLYQLLALAVEFFQHHDGALVPQNRMQGDGGVRHSSGGIEARCDTEGDVAARDLILQASLEPQHGEWSAVDAGECRQARLNEHAVRSLQFHQIRHRSNGRKRAIGIPAVPGAVLFFRLQMPHEAPRDPCGGGVRFGEVAHRRMQNRVGVGQHGRQVMVVEDDHVHACPVGGRDFVHSRHAGIYRHQQLRSAGVQFFDHAGAESVSFVQPVRQAEERLCTPSLKIPRQHGGGGDAVAVVIAENRHLLAPLHCAPYPFRCFCAVGKERRFQTRDVVLRSSRQPAFGHEEGEEVVPRARDGRIGDAHAPSFAGEGERLHDASVAEGNNATMMSGGFIFPASDILACRRDERRSMRR